MADAAHLVDVVTTTGAGSCGKLCRSVTRNSCQHSVSRAATSSSVLARDRLLPEVHASTIAW